MIRSLLLASTLALGAVAPAALAGSPHDGHHQCPHKMGGKSMDLVKRLDLEGSKAEEVEAMHERFIEERQALREEHLNDIKQLHEGHKTALAALLSDEEMQQLEQMWEKKREKKKTAHHHKGGKCPHTKSDE